MTKWDKITQIQRSSAGFTIERRIRNASSGWRSRNPQWSLIAAFSQQLFFCHLKSPLLSVNPHYHMSSSSVQPLIIPDVMTLSTDTTPHNPRTLEASREGNCNGLFTILVEWWVLVWWPLVTIATLVDRPPVVLQCGHPQWLAHKHANSGGCVI